MSRLLPVHSCEYISLKISVPVQGFQLSPDAAVVVPRTLWLSRATISMRLQVNHQMFLRGVRFFHTAQRSVLPLLVVPGFAEALRQFHVTGTDNARLQPSSAGGRFVLC